MRRLPWSTVFFALSLSALVALGVWWTVFLARAVELERSAHRAELFHRAQVTALRLGLEEGPLRAGPITGEELLEIVVSVEDDLTWPLSPNHSELSVKVSEESLEAIEERLSRRRVMVIGESALLFLLLAVFLVMLYRLTAQERAHLRRMEGFVSAFTHEMKTPLAGLTSLFQTMAAGRVPEERTSELIGLGLTQVDRLTHSIENVLLSGRLRSGRFELKSEAVALRALLGVLVDHREGVGDQLTLLWDPDAAELSLYTDEGALRIILDNLIDNGLKYGGGEVRLGVRCGEKQVMIDVMDDGVDLPSDAADMEALFRPFERGKNESERAPGTGLGLYISRTLARRMGGDITASKGERGAIFSLTLSADDGGMG